MNINIIADVLNKTLKLESTIQEGVCLCWLFNLYVQKGCEQVGEYCMLNLQKCVASYKYLYIIYICL